MNLQGKVVRCRALLRQVVDQFDDRQMMNFLFHIIIEPMLVAFMVGLVCGIVVCGLVLTK